MARIARIVAVGYPGRRCASQFQKWVAPPGVEIIIRPFIRNQLNKKRQKRTSEKFVIVFAAHQI